MIRAITARRPGRLEEAKEALLDFFLPARCAHCGGFGSMLCDDCSVTLVPLDRVCARCGSPEGAGLSVPYCGECVSAGFAFELARSAFVYSDAARSLVVGLKGGGLRSLAPLMADLGWAACAELLQMVSPAEGGNALGRSGGPVDASGGRGRLGPSLLFTWVPAHGSVQRRRGYNQAEILARRWAGLAGCEAAGLVKKTARTGHQQSLDRRGRRENLKGAFSTTRSTPPEGTKGVILVDDVYTTGATAHEVSAVIRESLGLPVYVFTFCRTPGSGSSARD